MADKITFSQGNGVALRSALRTGGPTTIGLIHELGGSLNSFDDLASHLCPPLSVIRADQRGMGLSEKVPGPYSVDALADDFAGILDHHGIVEPILVLGAAVGASVACAFALSYPQRIKALVLAAPALFIPVDRREAGHDMANRLEANGMREIADVVIGRSFPEALWESEDKKEETIARWLGADHRGYAATHRMLLDLDMTERLPDIAVPVLVLAGQQDPHAPPDFLDRVTAPLPQRTLRAIDAGHFMCAQSPRLVAAEIDNFVRQL